MIKTFEQFINENYNEKPVLALNEEYGAPLFNEVSESLMREIHNSINEGRLVIDSNMIEEGLFDTIGKLFKKGADKAGAVAADNEKAAEEQFASLQTVMNDTPDDYEAAFDHAKWRKEAKKDAEAFRKIEELCKSAEDICIQIAEKENEMYKTISEKMTAANKAIAEFTKETLNKINEIVESAENKASAVIASVMMFCNRMIEVAKSALKTIGTGVTLAFALPFLLAYTVYKGAVNICKKIIENVKDGAKAVKEVFIKIKNSIANWVKDMLKQAKEALQNACNAVKDGATAAYKAIGKAYLAIVAVLGQLASDAKDAISEAYNDFVKSVEKFTDDVKAFISEKWDVVSKWCKKTSTAFAEGVSNVWKHVKSKVESAAGAVSDAFTTLKDNANATWEDIKKWTDDKQKAYYKDSLKYAADKWGKDEISSWMDEL